MNKIPDNPLGTLKIISLMFVTQSILMGCGSSEGEQDSNSLTNTAPIANISHDDMVTEGETVSLSAASSSDVDGDNLSYAWHLLSLPNKSNASLSNSYAVETTFVADMVGEYSISLIVNDGYR